MAKSKLPRSVRIFLRKEKSRIRKHAGFELIDIQKKIQSLIAETRKAYQKHRTSVYRHHTMKSHLEAEKIDETRSFGARKNRRCTRSTLRIFPSEKQVVHYFFLLMECHFIV